jgi:hypothetical protein
MTKILQRFTKRYVNIVVALIGLAVVSSILLHSGCGMTSRPRIPTPTPTPTPDTTPPTVTSFSPAAGATNVDGFNPTVTVTFSEPMDARTITFSTIELTDPSGLGRGGVLSYSSSSSTARLVPINGLAGGVTYTVRIRGGAVDPRVKDLAGNALAADVIWTFTTAPDPPRVLSVTPTDGADAIPAGVAPRAVFSNPLDPATVTPQTVLLRDAAGNPIPVEVRHSPSAFTVALVPNGLLQPLQTYTVTLKGGPAAPNITDSTGKPLPLDFIWTFTIAAAPQQTTIFAPTDRPADNELIVDDMTPNGVELGMKFRSNTDGIITGVRFYKGGPQNGGSHMGHLWTGAGTPLRAVEFPGESASGWQQGIFQTPAPITAGETYVVSYFAPQKNYSATTNDFASGKDNGPLHALSNDEPPTPTGNGVFRYDPNPSPITPVFPNNSFNANNYWVDVVFVNPALDPPQVLSTTPNPGALLVSSTGQYPFPISATFSEPLNPATVNMTTVTLTDTAGKAVPADVSYTPGSLTVTITPQQGLQPGQAYTITLKGGADAPHIADLSGMPLASDFTWSITTTSLPEPSSTEETMISNRVTTGANFIAMRPDKQLASLLGLNYASSVLCRALKSAV